jgi:hypothetical protein
MSNANQEKLNCTQRMEKITLIYDNREESTVVDKIVPAFGGQSTQATSLSA